MLKTKYIGLPTIAKYLNSVGAEKSIELMPIGVLAEVSTGFPLLLSELTFTTAVRNAATSVMAAKYLTKPNPKKMAIIVSSCQSEFQAPCFHHILGVE